MSEGLGDFSMLELFLVEAQTQGAQMSEQLLELERSPNSPALLESLMRSAHSIKGAARIVELPSAVSVSHAMEDCFVAVQKGKLRLEHPQIDVLLSGVDLMLRLARSATFSGGQGSESAAEVEEFLTTLATSLQGGAGPAVVGKGVGVGGAGGLDGEVSGALKPADVVPTPVIAKPSIAVAEVVASPGVGVQNRGGGTEALTGRVEGRSGADRGDGGGNGGVGGSGSRRTEVQDRGVVGGGLAGIGGGNLGEGEGWSSGVTSFLRSPGSESETAMVKRGDGGGGSSRGVRSAGGGSGAAGGKERFVRVSSENMNRLMGLAGESKVHSRWVAPFGETILRLKRQQSELAKILEQLREGLSARGEGDLLLGLADAAKKRSVDFQRSLTSKLVELELFDRRQTHVAAALYDAVLDCRMRPFSDLAQGFPRMVRDLGRSLSKKAGFELRGAGTRVDRDILEKLDAPITHLLRNALDHGIESPEERLRLGKPEEGVITLEARHSAGMLLVIVGDDGCGIDLGQVREVVVRRGLSVAATAAKLSDSELLDFLFLPGFTMKERVTEISGRGVGLDVVRDMVKEVRGKVRILTQLGRGTRFQLELPLTLSVMRVLMVLIGGEPYAFPLAGISRTARVKAEDLGVFEGRPAVMLGGRLVGLVKASEVLGLSGGEEEGEEISVVELERGSDVYALVVDRFLGEREVVVHPLDSRLGKVHDISAGTILDDGTPALIVDVEDLVHSIESKIFGGDLKHVEAGKEEEQEVRARRILVVDDSLTVRELERKLLEARGYEVEIAVDGKEGWNKLVGGRFNLVISDVDMPRMDGIELVTMIKKDSRLSSIPVMIVSYKDREEDRRKGLEAGADYYLGKGSFHDQTLVNAVMDLIGPAK